jgi:hypothetical protein
MSRRRSRRERDRLGKLAPGEPYFVLRAGDPLAAEHVEAWAVEAALNDYPAARVSEARRTAAAMRRWGRKKTPD